MKIQFSTRFKARTFAAKRKANGYFAKVVDSRNVNGKWSVQLKNN